jgi:LEA14-like dessication related protein
MLLKEPVIAVKNAALRTFSLQSLTLDITLDVDNPNPVGISVKSLSFDLFYKDRNDWVYLSHGERAGFKINTRCNRITIPVTVSNAALLTALVGILAKGKITIRISGIALPDFLLFAPEVPFSREMTIPLRLRDL